ncbi:hypothetical protein DRD53_11790, partial [Salmonella enterica subsp. enterica serovar Telelkebir]|nr:hypothetical protein [Salmonella enterica subsp. enterica serovar Telelkebir]
MISCRDSSVYLLPSASVLLRFLTGLRTYARSPGCGERQPFLSKTDYRKISDELYLKFILVCFDFFF